MVAADETMPEEISWSLGGRAMSEVNTGVETRAVLFTSIFK